MPLSVLALTTLLIGCAGGSSRAPIVVVPSLPPYSAEFQNLLANEMEADTRVPCPGDILVPNCAAWKRAVIDHGRLRAQIRIVD